jgi:LacI family transcriptional regulator
MHMTRDGDATLKKIAAKSGVSVPTVSRVLSGKGERYRISQTTIDHVNRIATELKYTPNYLASSLRLKRTLTLGLIIPDISNPFFSSLARSVEKAARRAGYSIILCDSEETTKIEVESFKLLESRKVDGLIVSPVGQESRHFLAGNEPRVPMVLVDRYFPELPIPYVTSDSYRGAIEAVTNLIDNNHRRIACIQGLHDTSSNIDRVRGYVDAHKNRGLEVDESLIVGDNFGEENGYIEAKILMKRAQRPTAVFCVGNLISLGVLRAMAEEGLSIPQDLSLISFDDHPYFSFLSPPITTVAQQNRELGRIAAKLLLERIESPRIHETGGIFVPTKLLVRNSVRRVDGD